MFTFETADQKEVRRFRMAQFNGKFAPLLPARRYHSFAEDFRDLYE